MPFVLLIALVAVVMSFLAPEPPGGPEIDWAMRLGLRVLAAAMFGWALLKR